MTHRIPGEALRVSIQEMPSAIYVTSIPGVLLRTPASIELIYKFLRTVKTMIITPETSDISAMEIIPVVSELSKTQQRFCDAASDDVQLFDRQYKHLREAIRALNTQCVMNYTRAIATALKDSIELRAYFSESFARKQFISARKYADQFLTNVAGTKKIRCIA